jgi:hypothetical protein
MKTFGTLVVISIFMAVLTCSANGGTIYVDASATGANDGSSWANAFVYLQDALAVAVDGNDIWVAAGTYKPDHGAGITIGDINATFELKAGVAMYGGFPPGGGTWQQRNPNIYESRLSGDLNGDDQPGFLNRTDNSSVIANISWTEGITTLDAFTIRNSGIGITNYGQGYYGNGAQIKLANCRFTENTSFAIRLRHPEYWRDEGEEFGTSVGTEINDCTFENNYAPSTSNAVVYFRGYSPIFKNCVFKDNLGVRMVQFYSFTAWPDALLVSNPTFINTTFVGNPSFAVRSQGKSALTFLNCIFAGNKGALYHWTMSVAGQITLVNCTVANNNYDSSSGASIMTSDPYDPTLVNIKNCTFWNNTRYGVASASSQISGSGVVTVQSSCIQDDIEDGIYVYSGVTAYNTIDRNPRFVRNPYDGGDGWGVGNNDDYGDLRLRHNSPCIDAGDNAFVPADEYDVDGDGNSTEPIPFDLDSRARIVDGDCSSVATVDMGAYEFQGIPADLNHNGRVDLPDFSVLASQWLGNNCNAGNNWCEGADLVKDGTVQIGDLTEFVEWWLADYAKFYSLEAYWPMNETSGTVVSDSAGGHHGQTMNMAGTPWVAGKVGNCLSFDGIDDYVVMAGYKGITGRQSRTCAAWIKTPGMSQNTVVLSWGGLQWIFGLFGTGELTVYAGGPYIKTTALVNDNQWHHVAAVMTDDGSPNVSEIELYIDGVLQTTVNSPGSVNTVGSYDVLIGAFWNVSSPSGFFKGMIDDVRIYSQVLTNVEILNLYQNP